MRSLSITALLIAVAFVFGLALGGQMPREVAAQSQSEGISWETDGQSLRLINETADTAYLVTGNYALGAAVQAPAWYSAGTLKLSQSNDLDKIYVYKLQAELACDPRTCRRCDEGALCPTPDWPPPIGTQEVRSVVDHQP